MGSLSNPVGAQEVVIAKTTVFDGVAGSPAAYTDLDLSAVVGVNEAEVLLEIERGANDCGILTVRTNGDTRGNSDNLTYGDIHAAGQVFYRLVTTDAAGIIEWFTAVSVTLVVIKIVDFKR